GALGGSIGRAVTLASCARAITGIYANRRSGTGVAISFPFARIIADHLLVIVTFTSAGHALAPTLISHTSKRAGFCFPLAEFIALSFFGFAHAFRCVGGADASAFPLRAHVRALGPQRDPQITTHKELNLFFFTAHIAGFRAHVDRATATEP